MKHSDQQTVIAYLPLPFMQALEKLETELETQGYTFVRLQFAKTDASILPETLYAEGWHCVTNAVWKERRQYRLNASILVFHNGDHELKYECMAYG